MEEFLWENQLKIAFMLISLYCNDKCIQICRWSCFSKSAMLRKNTTVLAGHNLSVQIDKGSKSDRTINKLLNLWAGASCSVPDT